MQKYFLICLALVPVFFSEFAGADPFSDLGLKLQGSVSNFTVDKIYNDGEGHPMAVRFIHKTTCAPVTYIQKQIIPQFYISVETPPTTDQGLPHSLEHLLAGKGTKGRFWGLFRQMRMARTTAATQWNYTYYSFNTPLGEESFHEGLTALMDALFRPDFTDEEAVNEFYHFGVEKNSSTGELSLTEKGTVYSEMQSQIGYWDFWRDLNKTTLGKNHPWGFNSGGAPKAMRDVTPATIRAFHQAHYELGPATGLYVGLSPKYDVAGTLEKLDKTIKRFSEKKVPQNCSSHFADYKLNLYPIEPLKKPSIKILPFPSKSLSDPVEFWMAWNPVRTTSLVQVRLLDILLEILTKDAESPLYTSFISSEKRLIETGATGISADVSTGHSSQWPVPIIKLNGITGNRISEQFAEKVRSIVIKKIEAIGSLQDGAPELEAFKKKALASIKSRKRDEEIWLRSPPQLAKYEAFKAWKERFETLDLTGSSEVDSNPVWDRVTEMIQAQVNPWTKVIEYFLLNEEPHVAASLPSPELLKNDEIDRSKRIELEIEKLKKMYNVKDAQEALSKKQDDEKLSDLRSVEISSRVPKLHFTKNPPLVADPDIHYERGELSSKIYYHLSLFDETPEENVTLRFDLRALPPNLVPYLSALTLLNQNVGLDENGKITSSAELKNEFEENNVLLSNWLTADALRRKYQWVLWTSGLNPHELMTSLGYLDRVLRFPYLNQKNLPRIRELLNQRISQNDHLTQCCDIDWIQRPAYAFRRQDDLLYLAVNSDFTRNHWLSRILWQLHEPLIENEKKNFQDVLTAIISNQNHLSSSDWNKKILALPDQGIRGELRTYILKNMTMMPPENFQNGIAQLTHEISEDLSVGPKLALENLLKTKNIIFNQNLVEVQAETTFKDWMLLKPMITKYLAAVPAPSLKNFKAKLEKPNRIEQDPIAQLPVIQNIQKREPEFKAQFPFYLGFDNEDGTSGNAVITADGPTLNDLKRVREYLATKILSGTGTQSFWMKTWEAGLAHSNGVSSYPDDGEVRYYADRSTNISALMKLIRSEAAKSKDLHDETLGDYALAGSFRTERMEEDPMARADDLAADFRSGATPEKQKRFSQTMLKLSKSPNFTQDLISQTGESIASVLLTNDHQDKKKAAHSIFFFVGPENQLRDLDPEMPANQKLTRIWASDYWLDWPRSP